MNRMGLGLGLGSSKSLKKAWYSTQIFQKTLQQSLLAMVNSSVSWWAFCWRDAQAEISTDGRREEGENDGDEKKKRSAGTYSGVCSQFNEEPFAFEAELANLGPVEGVDFCVPLNTG